MRPIPVAFHIGPLVLHTYGFGLGITFWFAYWYLSRRFQHYGLSTRWLEKSFIWIIVMAVVGARTVHCIANISYYLAHPILVFAVWQGGLSSYGGIAGGLIVALYALHKYNPEISFRTAADVTAPVLLAAWAMGRLLGPQLMFAGGGHPTTAWYGMKYAGEVGYRIPVPIFQSIETIITFSIVLGLSRLYPQWKMPALSLAVTAYGIWSIGRFFDEYLWLAVPRVWDAVEVFALISLAGSIVLMLVLLSRRGKDTPVLAPPPQPLAAADAHG
ncbi:prolipoprotein diacylglyceryl transferase family protein [Ferrimicrobium sp.]|uniref:prolipoprotein diacylglyceryl transferase n=1 Tax=Ferrimicrobium sp. TaxID=2926050 RepID=UPI00261DB57A|nr:prolipoprotein diacylglyceryl transferase family protein [Ferrimicrobium sp.]